MSDLGIRIDLESTTLPTKACGNNSAEEASKAFDVRDGNTLKRRRFLDDESSLSRQFEALTGFARPPGRPLRGPGVDRRAGVGWTTAMLSRFPEERALPAVEFLRHRIAEIAPLVFRAPAAEEGKIVRAVGRFYDVRPKDYRRLFAKHGFWLRHRWVGGDAVFVGGRAREGDGNRAFRD